MRLILVALLFAISYAQTDPPPPHPIDTDCPPNTGTSDLTLDFTEAKVYHRNLNGHWCDSTRWCKDTLDARCQEKQNGLPAIAVTNDNGDLVCNGSCDGSVAAGEGFDPLVFDEDGLPESCHEKDHNAQPLEEILYCNVGTRTMDDGETEELCLRIVDLGGKYKCATTKKCGSVRSDSGSGEFYGQIQLNQAGDHEADIPLRFTVVHCAGEHGTMCVDRPWDNMYMTFLDIDGDNKEEEEIILFDAFDYILPDEFDTQWKYPAKGGEPFVAEWPQSDSGKTDLNYANNAFPDMYVQIDDPERVYRYQYDNDEWNDNANEGDVTIRNIPNDGSEGNNGDHDNPTILNELQPGQARRSVVGQWVSERWKNNHVNNNGNWDLTGTQRTYFDVSFGTKKRTILFAGEATGIVAECATCDSFFSGGGSCLNNGVPQYNRVCFLPSHDTLPSLSERCNADYCCDITPTTHGDPIVWTFNEECYDLNKDGLYLATGHPRYDHEVKIAVHNDFMREIQVVDSKTGEIRLAINNLGEVLGGDSYGFLFEQGVSPCPQEMKNTECDGEYAWFKFDANSFKFVVQQLRHDYMDPALKDGEIGFHLDIYPKPYKKAFKRNQDGYKGLYFENPLPDELEYCTGGSKHAYSK